MHIVLVTPAYPPLLGGGEQYAAALARGLVGRGHAVTVVTSAAQVEADLWDGTSGPLADTVENGVRVLRCPVRPFPGGRRGLMLWRKAMVVLSALPDDQSEQLARMARWVPPITGLDETLASLVDVDLVHAFNLSWEQGLMAAGAYSGHTGKPLVATPFAHLGTGKGDRVALNSTMDHQLSLLRRAAAVLVLTSIERDDLMAYGVAGNRIHVIGGGVDPVPVTTEQVALLDLPATYGLFIGRLSLDKGALHAADAVRMLYHRGRDVALLMVGTPAPEFTNYYEQLAAADRVAIRLLGFVDNAAKHRLLAGARFLMLPSRSDSFGIVMLEAWRHGVPVIAARAGGIPGVVDDGENGLLVAYGDVEGLATAAGRLLDDPALARRLGEQGRAKVETEYNWEHVTDRVLLHYSTILSGS